MADSVRTYRPYQRVLHEFLVENAGKNLGIESPPGSGKTMMVVGLVADAFRRGLYRGVLIATTQEQIEKRFTSNEFGKVRIGRRVVSVPDGMIEAARDGSKVRRRVTQFLRGAGSAPPDGAGFALACTHSALAGIDGRQLPRSLDGFLLVLDEGHHAPADSLSKFEAAWLRRGGTTLHVTATGYRSDGRRVGPPDAEWMVRSLAQHMEEGFAPRRFESEIRTVNGRSEKVSWGQMSGAKAPPRPYVRDIVRTMVSTWDGMGKPKSMVRVPPLVGGSQGLVQALVRAFRRRGARVVDATGPGAEVKASFISVLASEDASSFRKSKVDVIVGVQRVAEGTDWRHCEAVLCVGLPGSMTFSVQLTGRAMRMKDGTCPKRRRDVARAVYFVPTTGREVLDDLSVDHSRAVLLQACFMADSQSGQRWLLERELRKLKVVPKPQDQADRAEIILKMAAIKREASAEGRELTAAECVREILRDTPKSRADAIRDLVKTIVVESLTKSSSGKKVIRSIRRSRPDLGVPGSMMEIVDRVLDEFRDATLDGEDSIRIFGKQTHGLTGGSTREWADRVIKLILTEEDIDRILEDHYRSYRAGGPPRMEEDGGEDS